jgi:hypothetical protein
MKESFIGSVLVGPQAGASGQNGSNPTTMLFVAAGVGARRGRQSGFDALSSLYSDDEGQTCLSPNSNWLRTLISSLF